MIACKRSYFSSRLRIVSSTRNLSSCIRLETDVTLSTTIISAIHLSLHRNDVPIANQENEVLAIETHHSAQNENIKYVAPVTSQSGSHGKYKTNPLSL